MRVEEEKTAKCGHRVKVMVVLDQYMRQKDPVKIYMACKSVWDRQADECGECSGGGDFQRTEVDMDELIDKVAEDFRKYGRGGEDDEQE